MIFNESGWIRLIVLNAGVLSRAGGTWAVRIMLESYLSEKSLKFKCGRRSMQNNMLLIILRFNG